MKWFDKEAFKNTKLSDYMESGYFTGEARDKVIRYTKMQAIFSLVFLAVIALVAAIWHSSFSNFNIFSLILIVLFIANITYQIASKSTIFHLFTLQRKQNQQDAQGNKKELDQYAEDLKKKNNGGAN